MKDEKIKLLRSLRWPVLLVALAWLVFGIEHLLGADFGSYGILSRHAGGLWGIFTYPFIHGSLSHLFDNSVPLLILGTALFYFYDEIAAEVFAWMFFVSGFWLWLIGRPDYHIGASGLVYGLASFLFFSGVFRRNVRLLAISLFVVFLYGSLIWGIFPLPINLNISWEGHMAGAVAGMVLAWFFRKKGPKNPDPPKFDDDPDDSNPYWLEGTEQQVQPPPQQQNVIIHYIYKEKEGDGTN